MTTEEINGDAADEFEVPQPSADGVAWTSETEDDSASSPFGALAGALAPKPVEEAEPEAAPEDEADAADAADAADGTDDADGDDAAGAAVPEAEESPVAEAAEEEPAEPEVVVEPPPPVSPYDLPGDWYVIHSYSGYEKKVKLNLETRASSMHMEDRIFEVVIPMETVVEIKNGRKVEVPKKMFPGYILVRMYLDDDSWYAVRNTPGVTAFVGSGTKPTPLSRREVERFLGVKKEEEKKAPRFKPLWDIGEVIRVVDGPFADFNGVIEDINIDQQKVKVLVEIFGRDTPMELNFEQIQKQ
jgi:transcriptional antiterminator NusG